MHSVVVRIRIKDYAGARQMLEGRVLPMYTGADGFVTGVWHEPDDSGETFSVAVFESEDAARAVADRIEVPEGAPVELLGVEIRGIAVRA